MKKTVVIGASTNPSRYSYAASHSLTDHGHEIVPISIKKGSVAGKDILNIQDRPEIDDVDTVTMYVGYRNIIAYHDYIVSLKPERIIFNPGSENPELKKLAQSDGIETIEACTLVMLSVGNY
ncbi:MAG: CoA-binding protein [Bacteroidota bacterium]